MFLVSLLCIALFSQAFAQIVPAVTENEDEDDSSNFMEQIFAEQFPIPYKILDLIRTMLGITKAKMMKFTIHAVEVLSELKELWDEFKELFRRESPKANTGTLNYQQHTNQVPTGNLRYYYGY